MGPIAAAAYDAWYETPFGSLCHRLEREALFSLAEFGPSERVLDAGCGTGVYMVELRKTGARPVGLDISVDMLKLASERGLSRIELARGDIESLPFTDGSFDKVLCVCSIDFVKDPEKALAEMTRVVKGKGMLVLGFLNSHGPWAEHRKEMGKDPDSIWHGVRFFTLDEVADMGRSIGLSRAGDIGAVFFPPEAEDMDKISAEDIEYGPETGTASTPAFIGAAFIKP